MHAVRRPTIALLVPYWDFWADSTPFDLRRSREDLLRRGHRLLDRFGDVVVAFLLDVDVADRVGDAVATADPDVVVVMQTMATPPAVTTAVLGRLPSCAVVVWAARAGGGVGDDFDHAAVTAEGATVGTPMLTSVLVRAGRPFELVVGTLDDPTTDDRLLAAVRVAVAAEQVRRARIGRVGRPIVGYDCVDLSVEHLTSNVGITVVPIDPSEFATAYDAIDPRELASDRSSVLGEVDVDPALDDDAIIRALRAAAALEAVSRRHRLDAGAFNCHVPQIRLGETIGIAPCFALGRETSRGRPWTCSGDIVTVVAMLALKSLGAAAFYHELEAFDSTTGVFVQANSGEHDIALGSGRPRLSVNPWFPGPPASACAVITPDPGPATLVGFAQREHVPLHRLIVARGEFVGGGFPRTGTTNAGFRFAGRDAAASWRAWCLAGANHHGAVAPGDLVDDVRGVGRALGLDVVEIDEGVTT